MDERKGEDAFPDMPDLEWRFMRTHQEHLSTEYDKIKYILTLQERELAMQAFVIGVLVIVLIRQQHAIKHLMSKEGS